MTVEKAAIELLDTLKTNKRSVLSGMSRRETEDLMLAMSRLETAALAQHPRPEQEAVTGKTVRLDVSVGYASLAASLALATPAPAPAPSAEVVEALRQVVSEWEALPGDRFYGQRQIEDWLVDRMKPAIDKARAALASPAPAKAAPASETEGRS